MFSLQRMNHLQATKYTINRSINVGHTTYTIRAKIVDTNTKMSHVYHNFGLKKTRDTAYVKTDIVTRELKIF